MLRTALTTRASSAMTVVDAINKRRAVRSYAAERVDEETIHRLLEAAVLAPTAVHEEPWAFAVIEDRATLKRLSDDAKEAIGELGRSVRLPGEDRPHRFAPPDDLFYGASALIAIYGKPLGRFVAADCWLAAENLMLAACAMGLGTCVIGLAVPALDGAKWKRELNVPEEMTAYAPIIVGVPAGETPPTGRRAPEILSWRKPNLAP